MIKSFFTFLAGISFVAIAPMAHASVEIDAFNEALTKEYGDYLKDLNARAELSGDKEIGGGYVFSTFPAALYTNGGTYGLDSYVRTSCTSSVEAVRDLAANKEVYKKAIAKKIKRVDCAFGGKAAKDFKITFTKGVLRVAVSQEVYGGDTAEKVGDFVKKNL